MNPSKLKELIEEKALSCLRVTDACAVTFSKVDGIEIWWTSFLFQAKTPELHAAEMVSQLRLTNEGIWESKSPSLMKYVTKDVHFNLPFAITYREFVEFIEDKEDWIINGGTKNILSDIMVRSTKPMLERVKSDTNLDDSYPIQTQYFVDGTTYTDLNAAKRHIKVIQIFDLFVKSCGELEYHKYENLIKDMIDNPDKYIKILKGE